MRKFLFISHANPEDNEFTRWLSLQLAKEGYPVWCDLTKLLGGEKFWDDIEKAIRKDTVKFIFVLSQNSTQESSGCRDELSLATSVAKGEKNLKDFIIPLHIDNLPYRESNIEIFRINAISFEKSWAAGLVTLLEKLEKDKVEKSSNFNPEAVSSWWKGKFSSTQGIEDRKETYLSNLFKATSFHENIFLHYIGNRNINLLFDYQNLEFPVIPHGQYLISFGTAEQIHSNLRIHTVIQETHQIPFYQFLSNELVKRIFSDDEQKRILTRIFRISSDKFMVRKKLQVHQLSNRTKCFYFPKDSLKDNKIFFNGLDGTRTWRAMYGYSEAKERFWHFGIQLKPILMPEMALLVKSHVLFSNNGVDIWTSKSSLHKARRSHCRNWYNRQWGDRILGTMSWLSEEDSQISIFLGDNSYLRVSINPMEFNSPCYYDDPQEIIDADEVDYEEEQEEDEEEL